MRQINRLDGVPFILMAMNTGDEQKEIELLHAMGLVDYVYTQGYWRGVPEKSYAVFFKSAIEYQDIMRLAHTYQQEAVLVVDSDRNADLVYLGTNRREPLGRFTGVSKDQTLGLDAYTYVPSMDTYFITKKVAT